MIVSLYAGGMTIRDIQHHLVRTVGTELSPETISKITDEVLAEVLAWQRRPLEAFYPVIYLDALVVKVRDGAHVRNKAAHIAVGVDLEGVKHVLGIWVQASEGSKFWAGVCAELANRGIRDVLVVCCDGLTGFAEAIEATWGQATIQTSSMHHGAGGIVPLVVCTVTGRTYANELPSRSACRPVRPWRGGLDEFGQREQHFECRDEVPGSGRPRVRCQTVFAAEGAAWSPSSPPSTTPRRSSSASTGAAPTIRCARCAGTAPPSRWAVGNTPAPALQAWTACLSSSRTPAWSGSRSNARRGCWWNVSSPAATRCSVSPRRSPPVPGNGTGWPTPSRTSSTRSSWPTPCVTSTGTGGRWPHRRG